MDLPNDKELPDSHPEGEPLEAPHPVRFVWDKTTKQSAHNGRMKLRVLEDFRARRRLYKHVPDREFSKKLIDGAFEQSFTTFRQKFTTHRDELAASRHKEREDAKARKSRHILRRKTVRFILLFSRREIDHYLEAQQPRRRAPKAERFRAHHF